jgi:RNA polymerase sigma-70 factor (ECF subfamily)
MEINSCPSNQHRAPRTDDRLGVSYVRSAPQSQLEARTNAAMQRYAWGDDRAFDELYVLLAPRLRRMCLRLTDVAEAEDVCQETFIKIHRARATYSDRGNVSTWACIIARRTLLDRIRYRRRRPELALEYAPLASHSAADSDCPESNLDQARYEGELDRQVSALSDSLRSAYELVKVKGLSYSEAGAILDTSDTAVKQRMHRVKQQLTAALHQFAL